MYLRCRRCDTKTRGGYALHCRIIWKWVNVPNQVNEQWRRVFQNEGVHPCMPPVKPLEAMVWSPWGCHPLGVTWARQMKGGEAILESCRKITWRVSAWWAPKIWWHLPAGVRAIMKRRQRPLPCINPLSTNWILRLYLNCFHRVLERCEVTPGRWLFGLCMRGLVGRGPK